ncbi:MAG: hypothetical protein FJZ47_10170, partial [Candidatus Tectomicrobia bacterium]|nr:hypothetical protein [Candidatus Tectomicrobia bacterium]
MSRLRKRHRTSSAQGEARPCAGMRQVTLGAAGGDRGAHAIVAGVPDGDAQQIVRTCGTYTTERPTLADWWVARGIQPVSMASTGVYGRPWVAACEARGLHGCRMRAASLTRVPGRTS